MRNRPTSRRTEEAARESPEVSRGESGGFETGEE
jgi:hypothetical protein